MTEESQATPEQTQVEVEPAKPEKFVADLKQHETSILAMLLQEKNEVYQKLSGVPEFHDFLKAEQALMQFLHGLLQRAGVDPTNHGVSPDLKTIIRLK